MILNSEEALKMLNNARGKTSHDGELVRYNTLALKNKSYDEIMIDNVDEVFNTLVENNIKDKKTKKEHIKNIKNTIEKKLPKCGGELVEREGKYGKFLGCSNYPKCKYTKNC